MAILDLNNCKEKERYATFVRNHEYKSLMQDPSWAEVKDNWGREYVYLENDQGEIYAAMSILIRTVQGGFSLFYTSRGPVSDFYDVETTKKLVEEVRPLAKKYKAFALKMDPEVSFDAALSDSYVKAGFKVQNEDADFDELIQPRYNIILYLENHDEESIMSKFKGSNRNKVRKTLKNGLVCRWGREDSDVETFYQVYDYMSRRNGITSRDIDYIYRMRDAFGDNLRIYLVSHDDDVLAGGICVNYFGKAYYLYAGSNDTKRNMYPNQRMLYEMIRWSIEEGATQFDFGGVKTLDNSDGLFQFKKHFAYQDEPTIYIGEVDYVFNQPLYYLFTKGAPMFRKLKKKIGRR